MNQQIQISPIRLIDEKGQNLGVVETGKALSLAREKGLDLIELAPFAKPPVCRIMDFGKYQYQQSAHKKKSKPKKIEVKGIRLSLKIGQHDLATKARQAAKFLNREHKVKIEMRLRGREKAHFDLAKEKLEQFIRLIPLEVKFEQEIKRQPNGFNLVIAKDNEKQTQIKKVNAQPIQDNRPQENSKKADSPGPLQR